MQILSLTFLFKGIQPYDINCPLRSFSAPTPIPLTPPLKTIIPHITPHTPIILPLPTLPQYFLGASHKLTLILIELTMPRRLLQEPSYITRNLGFCNGPCPLPQINRLRQQILQRSRQVPIDTNIDFELAAHILDLLVLFAHLRDESIGFQPDSLFDCV